MYLFNSHLLNVCTVQTAELKMIRPLAPESPHRACLCVWGWGQVGSQGLAERWVNNQRQGMWKWNNNTCQLEAGGESRGQILIILGVLMAFSCTFISVLSASRCHEGPEPAWLPSGARILGSLAPSLVTAPWFGQPVFSILFLIFFLMMPGGFCCLFWSQQ